MRVKYTCDSARPCKLCGEVKQPGEFYRNNLRPKYVRMTCKECERQQAAEKRLGSLKTKVITVYYYTANDERKSTTVRVPKDFDRLA